MEPFQSTLPRGSDCSKHRDRVYHPEFQSTLPRGSDRTAGRSRPAVGHFNPRSLAGATIWNNYVTITLDYFNPRSLTGATYDKLYDAINHDISIHAPSRERHLQSRQSWHYSDYFNPRSLTGATRPICFIFAWSIFQSTLPHGSDQSGEKCRAHFFHFNPRSLTGATIIGINITAIFSISIHAPSRERQRVII